MYAFTAALADFLWHFPLRWLLFTFLAAESAHNKTMGAFTWLMKLPGLRRFTSACFRVEDPRLRVRRFGREFPNPVGLSAGMDKNAKWHNDLAALGFGFIEVGTITARPQPGNPKPYIFRLPQDQALLNRMGSPNDGAEAVAARLAARPATTTLGINIGKTTTTPIEDALDDYRTSFEHLYPFADYFVLNISSPNTPGLRKLQAIELLTPILRALAERNLLLARDGQPKPILVKIAPDLDEEQLHAIVDLCAELHLAGIIVANTTTSRAGLTTPDAEVQALGAGGISGLPLTQRSRELVAAVYRRTRGTLPIIGVGGIMSPEDAWQMIRAGACLVQIHTGFVYRGPGFVAAINRYVREQLSKRGIASIEDVVGEASGLTASGPGPLDERAPLPVNS